MLKMPLDAAISQLALFTKNNNHIGALIFICEEVVDVPPIYESLFKAIKEEQIARSGLDGFSYEISKIVRRDLFDYLEQDLPEEHYKAIYTAT